MRPLVLCLAAALAAAVPAAGAIGRGAEGAEAYADTTGEDPAAPDLVRVRVSNDDAGVITFRGDVPNRPVLTDDMRVYVWIDADLEGATGVGGMDYWLLVDPITYHDHDVHGFYCANDVCGPPPPDRPSPSGTITHTYANGPIIAIDRSFLGNTRRFGFAMHVVDGIALRPGGGFDFTNYHRDVAPDDGTWIYDVTIGPGRLVAENFSTRPAKPRSGRDFSARLQAVRADNGLAVTSGKVICKASVAGRRVVLARRGFADDKGICTWRIPAGKKGKTLSGSISIVVGNARVVRSFTGQIVD